jgi:hypothetical protein
MSDLWNWYINMPWWCIGLAVLVIAVLVIVFFVLRNMRRDED